MRNNYRDIRCIASREKSRKVRKRRQSQYTSLIRKHDGKHQSPLRNPVKRWNLCSLSARRLLLIIIRIKKFSALACITQTWHYPFSLQHFVCCFNKIFRSFSVKVTLPRKVTILSFIISLKSLLFGLHLESVQRALCTVTTLSGSIPYFSIMVFRRKIRKPVNYFICNSPSLSFQVSKTAD